VFKWDIVYFSDYQSVLQRFRTLAVDELTKLYGEPVPIGGLTWFSGLPGNCALVKLEELSNMIAITWVGTNLPRTP
jgi:hypothetical protein